MLVVSMTCYGPFWPLGEQPVSAATGTPSTNLYTLPKLLMFRNAVFLQPIILSLILNLHHMQKQCTPAAGRRTCCHWHWSDRDSAFMFDSSYWTSTAILGAMGYETLASACAGRQFLSDS